MTTFKVCVGSCCHLKGSYNVLCTMRQLAEELQLHDKIEVKPMFCTGNCTEAVSVLIGDETFDVTGAGAREFFLEKTADVRA